VRILIVKTSSMGDVVHALPLAADLAAARPAARIDWVVEEAFSDIPAMSRHVHRVHRVALRRWRRRPFAREIRHELREAQAALREGAYDLVIDAQGLLKSAWVAHWAHAPVLGPSSEAARERFAALFYDERVTVPRALHAVERCRRLGAAALCYELDSPPRFDLRVHGPRAVEVEGRTAVLLANASRATKLWPEAHWIALESHLAAQGLASVLFAGDADEFVRARRLADRMVRACVAPRSAIASIAATLAGADLVVGLDTGLTHLAAAMGRPTVGIFCDYDPRLVGLVGDGAVASLGGVGQSPSAHAVIAAADSVRAS
jgi:heptosyltransferase-1